MEDDTKKRIAIFSIFTGNYSVFYKQFIKSIAFDFLPECDKHFFICTDKKLPDYKCVKGKVTQCIIDDLPWPFNTLRRYEFYNDLLSEDILNYDYVFFLNSNTRCKTQITINDINLEKDFTFTLHDNHFMESVNEKPFERDEVSTAQFSEKWVNPEYIGGRFFGAKPPKFSEMCIELENNINLDLEKDFIATWHDESHLNWYYNTHKEKISYNLLPIEYHVPEEHMNREHFKEFKMWYLDKNKKSLKSLFSNNTRKKQTIYIYRTVINGGGCGKIIYDLVKLLNKNNYEIVIISDIISQVDFFYDEYKNNIPVINITLPQEIYWRNKTLESIKQHIDCASNPTLISFLDFDSNKFFEITSGLLSNNIHWINFDTNHPRKIQTIFKSKNEGVGITYEDLCKSVDVIRLENHNFTKYFSDEFQSKIKTFYNSVYIPRFNKLDLPNKMNLLCVNGLRENRKSILPFVENMKPLTESEIDFKLYIIGVINPGIEGKLKKIYERNPEFESHIVVIPPIQNLHDYYASCDLMITTAMFEGTSNAILESFVHNLPVIGLKTAMGICDTINHSKNGLLSETAESCVVDVINLLKNESSLEALKSGCNEIKEELLNTKIGIEQYLEMIVERTYSHDSSARKKLTDYSKQFLRNQIKYKEKLDAIIVYVDETNYDKNAINELYKTDAYKSCERCFFMLKFKESSSLFETDYIDSIEKNELLFSYDILPSEVSNYIQTNNASDGLATIILNEKLKNYLNSNSFDTILYIDTTKFDSKFVEKYKDNLVILNELMLSKNKMWSMNSEVSVSGIFKFSILSRLNLKNFCEKYHISKNKNKICDNINLFQEIILKNQKIKISFL